jgi:hypothetical protein
MMNISLFFSAKIRNFLETCKGKIPKTTQGNPYLDRIKLIQLTGPALPPPARSSPLASILIAPLTPGMETTPVVLS